MPEDTSRGRTTFHVEQLGLARVTSLQGSRRVPDAIQNLNSLASSVAQDNGTARWRRRSVLPRAGDATLASSLDQSVLLSSSLSDGRPGH